MGIERTILKALGAYSAHQAQSAAAESAISEQRRQYEATRRELSPVTGIYDASMGSPVAKSAPQSAKCPCCGSRQFKVHASRRICTYCRSEQDGQPVQSGRSDLLAFQSNMAAMRYENYYNQLPLRPEVAVRIAKL